MDKAIEIFALITGVVYVILEIRQKNFMWVLGILTSLASMWMFYDKGAYASFVLNAYYFVTAFIGLWQWRRDGNLLSDDRAGQEGGTIHLRRLTARTAALGLVFIAAVTVSLSWGMEFLHEMDILKENPMSWLDASIAAVSAVATWWLVKSYLQQWWLWIISNTMSLVLCLMCQMWWMSLLYVAYLISALIGLRYWNKHGVFVDNTSSAK